MGCGVRSRTSTGWSRGERLRSGRASVDDASRCVSRFDRGAPREVTSVQVDEGTVMGFSPGDHVLVEAESTDRAARRGAGEEVVRDEPHPRYRIRWDDGHESIYTPAAGAMKLAKPAGRSP